MARRLHRRPRPAQQCEAVDSADFGYGDAEEHPCTSPATHRARITEHPAAFGQPGAPTPARVLMCAYHAAQWDAAPGYGERSSTPAYRYRSLASA